MATISALRVHMPSINRISSTYYLGILPGINMPTGVSKMHVTIPPSSPWGLMPKASRHKYVGSLTLGTEKLLAPSPAPLAKPTQGGLFFQNFRTSHKKFQPPYNHLPGRSATPSDRYPSEAKQKDFQRVKMAPKKTKKSSDNINSRLALVMKSGKGTSPLSVSVVVTIPPAVNTVVDTFFFF